MSGRPASQQIIDDEMKRILEAEEGLSRREKDWAIAVSDIAKISYFAALQRIRRINSDPELKADHARAAAQLGLDVMITNVARGEDGHTIVSTMPTKVSARVDPNDPSNVFVSFDESPEAVEERKAAMRRSLARFELSNTYGKPATALSEALAPLLGVL